MRGSASAALGHREAFFKIPDVLDWCGSRGVGIVSLWMLSDDNIKRRSLNELNDIFEIQEEVLELLVRDGEWKIRHIGQRGILPSRLASLLKEAERVTRDRPGLCVNLAIGYGGRAEIIEAVRLMLADVKAGTDPDVAANRLPEYLYTAGQADADLIIRPSGEIRTSGFLLWQSALAELYFCDKYWPDFSKEDLDRALDSYAARHRRYGG